MEWVALLYGIMEFFYHVGVSAMFWSTWLSMNCEFFFKKKRGLNSYLQVIFSVWLSFGAFLQTKCGMPSFKWTCHMLKKGQCRSSPQMDGCRLTRLEIKLSVLCRIAFWELVLNNQRLGMWWLIIISFSQKKKVYNFLTKHEAFDETNRIRVKIIN